MEFVKSNIVLLLAATITVALSVVIIFFTFKTLDEMREFEQKVKNLRDSQDEIKKFDWALDRQSVRVAKTNSDVAREATEGLSAGLKKKYPAITIDGPMDALGLRHHLRSECGHMTRKLLNRGVELPASLGFFDFDKYMQANYFPERDEIQAVRRNLEIVKELVDLISRSGITTLGSLKRTRPELHPAATDLYWYTPYRIVAMGDIAQIQELIRVLGSSNYFFIVRHVRLSADDVVPTISIDAPSTPSEAPARTPSRDGRRPGEFMPPGGEPAPPPAQEEPEEEPARPKSREDRVVFTKLAMMQVELINDGPVTFTLER